MAIVRGTAGKTLIGKSLKTMLFGLDKDFHAVSKGMQGERRVGKELKKLPEGWRIWHDLDIGGENLDHVVASAKGVFVVEAKNYAGSVLATPKGLYTHGQKKPNDKVTKQVWRQVYKLNDLLEGQFVLPVLVFTNEVKGYKAKGISCMTLERLVPFLRDHKNRLSYEEARRLFATLGELTK